MSSPLLPSARTAIDVAVTELEYGKAIATFQEAAAAGLACFRVPGGEAELAAAVRASGARHVVVGVEIYHGPLYEALSAGGVIARFGVGHDNIDKAFATSRGLLCTNTPGALHDSVTEHTINLLLAAARHTVTVAAALSAGSWQPRLGVELKGKTLVVAGCGPIGQRVAGIAARGFGMHVIGVKQSTANIEHLQRDWGFATVTTDFRQAVGSADFLSLHVPGGPETHHFMDRARLELLPPRCWVVNTARGSVVDEAALYDALATGRLAGAALDVFAREPYEPAEPERDLRRLPNVILTPHVGSSTREAAERMAQRALQNLRWAQCGQWEEMDLLNREVLDSLKRGPKSKP